jgi:hypothetical protein
MFVIFPVKSVSHKIFRQAYNPSLYQMPLRMALDMEKSCMDNIFAIK